MFFLKLQLKILKIYTLFLLLDSLSTQDSNHGLPIFFTSLFLNTATQHKLNELREY